MFSRETLENHPALIATAAVVVLLALIVEMDVLDRLFTLTDLSSGQWLVCAAIGSAILWVGELLKLVLRGRARSRSANRAAKSDRSLGSAVCTRLLKGMP